MDSKHRVMINLDGHIIEDPDFVIERIEAGEADGKDLETLIKAYRIERNMRQRLAFDALRRLEDDLGIED